MDSHDWDTRYRTAESLWGAAPNRWVAQEAGDLPPGRALDLACGEGRNSVWLAARGWQVTGVDFSAVALDRARRLAAEQPAEVAARLTWLQADLLAWAPGSAAFDLVLVAYLQLPAAERGIVLRRAAAAVAPGGTLLVVGHHTGNLADGIGGPQDARVLFTPEDVLADLADSGLRTIRADAVRRPAVSASGEPGEALDALVSVRRPTSPLPTPLPASLPSSEHR